MTDKQIAIDLRIAKTLIALEFDDKDQYERYLEKHPGANKTDHTVKGKKVLPPPPEDVVKENENEKGDPVERMKKADNFYGLTKAETRNWSNWPHNDKDVIELTKSMDDLKNVWAKGNFETDDAKLELHKAITRVRENYNKAKRRFKSDFSGRHIKMDPEDSVMAHIKPLLDKHEINHNSDEIREMVGFKHRIKKYIPLNCDISFYENNRGKLVKSFIDNMDPENYSSAEAFSKAKSKIKNMPVEDVIKLLSVLSAKQLLEVKPEDLAEVEQKDTGDDKKNHPDGPAKPAKVLQMVDPKSEQGDESKPAVVDPKDPYTTEKKPVAKTDKPKHVQPKERLEAENLNKKD